MNKHIELVKKWINDPDSVSQEELVANRKAAYAAYVAANETTYDSNAAYWVNRYEELTNGNK